MLVTDFPIIYDLTCAPNMDFIEFDWVRETDAMALLSKVMDIRLEQSEKAELRMPVKVLGILTEVAQFLHFTIVLSVINSPSSVSSSQRVAPQLLLLVSVELLINKSFIKKHPSNAEPLMLVTLFGMVMEVRPMQL